MKLRLAVSIVLLILGSAAFAQTREESLPFGYVRSFDAYSHASHPTAPSLMISAEMELKYKHYEKAIWLCEQALLYDPDDFDVHLTYSQALGEELRFQQRSELVLKSSQLYRKYDRERRYIWRIQHATEIGNDVPDEEFPETERKDKPKQLLPDLAGMSGIS
jgi:hypothetical protein